MKVVIIGGVAGGASTAARLRRLNENARIIIFERGKSISFANCAIPYYTGDVIKDREKLEILTPKMIKELLNVEARIDSEVLKIDKDAKTVRVLDRITGAEYEQSYDKLVLSPGASPVKPPIPGIDSKKIFTVRNLEDADLIKNAAQGAKRAAIIGAGYIGLEMAENLAHAGIEVSVIEMSDQVLNTIDYEMAAQVNNHLRSKGVNLLLQEEAVAFDSPGNLKIKLKSNKELDVDFAVLAIGVRPENKLAADAGLEIGKSGGIKVNEYLQTSDEDIYAVGDAIEIKDLVSQNDCLIPLAGPANRQGRIAAENICGIKTKYEATQGTAILKVFDLTAASSGNSEKQLRKNKIPYLKSYSQGFSHAEYYPLPFPLIIKLLFSPDNGKILGAQVIGMEGADKRIDVLATAIKFEKTVKDLIGLELAYAPPYGSAKDPVNIAGMVAENILNGYSKPVYWNEVDELTGDSVFLDVRTTEEQALGGFEGSVNIPLEEIRSRLEEIPGDKRIITYCSKGLKSYFASRILIQKGFENVYSLNGGYSIYKQVIQNKGENLVMNSKQSSNNLSNVKTAELIEIDACGMQCPGPIMKLAEKIQYLEEGTTITIKTTDPGFKKDIESWCYSTGNILLEVSDENKVIKAQVQKAGTRKRDVNSPAKTEKTLVVFSNDLDKALASFIIANGAAATGNQVNIFFTFWGLNVLRKPEPVKVKKGLLDTMFGFMMPKGPTKLSLSKMHMMGMGTEMMKYVMKSKNVNTLQELMKQARDNGVKFIACQMSMDVMGIKPEELIDGVEIGGVAAYINSAEKSDVNLFI